MDVNQTIGIQIGKLRNSKQESQKELAEAIGVSRETVAYWETNKRNVTHENILKIANHYNASIDYIYGLDDVPSREIDIKNACKYTGLSEACIQYFREKVVNNMLDSESKEMMYTFILYHLDDFLSLYSKMKSVLSHSISFMEKTLLTDDREELYESSEFIEEINRNTNNLKLILLDFYEYARKCFEPTYSDTLNEFDEINKDITEFNAQALLRVFMDRGDEENES